MHNNYISKINTLKGVTNIINSLKFISTLYLDCGKKIIVDLKFYKLFFKVATFN